MQGQSTYALLWPSLDKVVRCNTYLIQYLADHCRPCLIMMMHASGIHAEEKALSSARALCNKLMRRQVDRVTLDVLEFMLL